MVVFIKIYEVISGDHIYICTKNKKLLRNFPNLKRNKLSFIKNVITDFIVINITITEYFLNETNQGEQNISNG